MPRLLKSVEGRIRATVKARRFGAAGVSSPRHAFIGILQELGKTFQSPPRDLRGKFRVEGNQRPGAMDWEGSYEPIVPVKMGNRRATEQVAATGPIGGKGRTKERIG
jgi:hypothetical protein